MKTFAARILDMVPWGRAKAPAAEVLKGPEPLPAPAAVPVAGSEPGWLRVLTAEQLLATVKAGRALEAIWRQSRQSQQLWERDLLPAIHRYAEFVQLMPASEAHHHAHAGGLLSHTLEMLVAAMTWRNGMLLPGGSQIEVIDAQRDQWSYVVFFATLLHDIAKPMTDLRIGWRCDGMADATRWVATGGSLAQITAGRPAPEYLVDFAPKSQRDYGAHARLAQLLLSRIAPEPALKFLAHTPDALDALDKYLRGEDRDSLVATLVRRADQHSTQQALKSGKQGRFPTSKAVPLFDLMMQAITSMLQAGTELPLNRSGGSAWVYDGAIWFVAKRLADTVREWIKKHEPDESVPGDDKNDRLFDTWQDYGVLELNPLTGQAIWHVTVHGQAAGSEAAAGQGYTHDLAMLKFPLAKVFSHESKYPALMQGRLEVREKRKDDAGEGSGAAAMPRLSNPAAGQGAPEAAAGPRVAAAGVNAPAAKRDANQSAADKKLAAVMRDPVFKPPPAAAKPADPKPDPAPPLADKPAPGHKAQKPAPVRLEPEAAPVPAAAPKAPRPAPEHQEPETAPRPAAPEAGAAAPPAAAPRAFEIDPADAAYLLDGDDFLEALAPVATARSMQGARPAQPPKARSGGAAAPAQSSEAAAVPARPAPSVQELDPDTGPGQAPEAAATSLPEAAARPEATGAQAPAEKESPALDPAPHHEPEPAPVQPTRSKSVSAEYRRLVVELDELPPVVARASVTRPAPAAAPEPVLLLQELPDLDDGEGKPPPEPSELALDFMHWVQQSLARREMKFNETGAMVHFVEEGMALVSPRIFKEYAKAAAADAVEAAELATRVQRELIKCGWHLPGPNKINIVRYEIRAKGAVVGQLACVVLIQPGRFVQPVPPSNPALKMA